MSFNFSNVWSTFKSELNNAFNQTPKSDSLGRVYLTDNLEQEQTVEAGVAVTPKGVLDNVKIGTYTGESSVDNEFQHISLGFKPRAVLISSVINGFSTVGKKISTYGAEQKGGLIIENADGSLCIKECGQITDDGFKVCNNNGEAELNSNNERYAYIAWR